MKILSPVNRLFITAFQTSAYSKLQRIENAGNKGTIKTVNKYNCQSTDPQVDQRTAGFSDVSLSVLRDGLVTIPEYRCCYTGLKVSVTDTLQVV